VEEAVADGRENARHNGITTMEFVHGEAESVIDEEFTERMPAPDLVVLDPPRAGLHRDAVDAVMRLAPKQILYVSCKPSTQARDLQLFRERYDVLRMQPVDMFPQTYHIENVCDLRLRGQEPSRS
jgi:23S rRNA (uracil1939-C5)-methyltransferase